MKGLLLLLLCAVPSLLFAQDGLLYGVFPMEEGRAIYSKVYEVPGVPKDQLFQKVKEWAVNTFKSQKATLETEDKEVGFIAYKGYFEALDYYRAGIYKGKPVKYKVFNTLKFYIKDEKVKIVLSDIEVINPYEELAAAVTNAMPQAIRLEAYEDELDRRIEKKTISAKNAEKWKSNNRESFTLLDKQIWELINGIGATLARKRSEFEF